MAAQKETFPGGSDQGFCSQRATSSKGTTTPTHALFHLRRDPRSTGQRCKSSIDEIRDQLVSDVNPPRHGDNVDYNDTWAQTSSGIAIDNGHDVLYQLGDNPFAPYHGVSLLSILQNFLAHAQTGSWSVDERGVSDPIDKFREAEAEESWDKYIVPMGHGEFW